jgi:hypothetical protein
VVSGETVPALETVREAVVTCDPTDPQDIAKAAERAMEPGPAQDERRRRGLELVRAHAWSANAANYLRLYARALDRPVEELLRPGATLPA